MRFKKFPSCRKAFTLNEILVVIIILGVLAGLALPRFNIIIERMRAKEAENMLRHIYIAEEAYLKENDALMYAPDIDDLEIEIPPLKYFNDLDIIADWSNTPAFTRKTNAYTLYLMGGGEIQCTDNVLGEFCIQLGYPVVP